MHRVTSLCVPFYYFPQVLCYYLPLNFLQTYLKFEQSSGDPARVQLLYERAVTEFPVSSDLWLDYTRYLDKTLKVSHLYFYFHFLMVHLFSFTSNFYFLPIGRQGCAGCLFKGY